MIKEKHLVPGRVLLRAFDHPTKRDHYNYPLPWWIPCMVISVIKDVSRRHAKKTAPADGWEVLVIWWGAYGGRALEQVRILPHQTCWKPAPF